MSIGQGISPMRVAVIDDESITCREIKKGLLRQTDFEVETFPDGESAIAQMGQTCFDLVICDLKLPGIDGIGVLNTVKKRFPDTEVILITAHGTVDVAVRAIQGGAFHFVSKPFKMEVLTSLAVRALETVRLVKETQALKKTLFNQSRQQYLIGHSPAMQQVMTLVKKVCSLNCNVLILGESGTGKELTARALHFIGERREKPFVAFSCGGFTDELIANELFGHEKGAFTGAVDTKIGLLESAHTGTIFLDEVGLMPMTMQAKLLRFIQERNLTRVGGLSPIPVDVRLIAATNQDLTREVEQQSFREDLYFRLKVVTLTLPPLRTRKEDIPLLIHHFLERYNRQFKKKITGIDGEALALLNQYPFPGNVRELENIVERAVALSDGSQITCRDLPADILELSFTSLESEGDWKSLREVERAYIRKVLQSTGYNKVRTAQILELPRTTLWRKIKQFKL